MAWKLGGGTFVALSLVAITYCTAVRDDPPAEGAAGLPGAEPEGESAASTPEPSEPLADGPSGEGPTDDDLGDNTTVETVTGEATPDEAAGSALAALRAGFDPDADEYQFQLVLEGNGPATVASPDTGSYGVTMSGTAGERRFLVEGTIAADGTFSGTVSDENGVPIPGATTAATFNNDQLLWLTVTGIGAGQPVSTADASIRVTVTNADGSDRARITSTGTWEG